MSIEAMRQALEVLEHINQFSIGENAIALPGEIDGAMDSLRASIEHAEKRQWVGLTEEEIEQIADSEYEEAFVRLIEAKLKEKNQ
jgi:hypothetical protein